MNEKSQYIIVFITASSLQEAEKLATVLVEKRLAACGNIISDIRSVFWWQDTLEVEQEVLLMLKSRSELFSEIVAAVKKIHSYDVPEIIALPIIFGSEEYLDWLNNETRGTQG
jgi:periplasmic divalent cation tolerance protein